MSKVTFGRSQLGNILYTRRKYLMYKGARYRVVGKAENILSLFHHLHYEKVKGKEEIEDELHHCGGDHPGAEYTIEHCEHGKHRINKNPAIGHAWDTDAKPVEMLVKFKEKCTEGGWWHIESGKIIDEEGDA